MPKSGLAGREESREGEAPAEPHSRKLLIEKGSAGASPSRTADVETAKSEYSPLLSSRISKYC
jgi:hypothetical protein